MDWHDGWNDRCDERRELTVCEGWGGLDVCRCTEHAVFNVAVS